MCHTVGVLITNYKAWPHTERTVNAVLDHCGDAVRRVIVVDDCSDAPEEFPVDSRVAIHKNAANIGYAPSINVGMALMNEDIVVVLDCDARPLMPFVQTVLVAFAADEKLGVLGFLQTDDTGQLRTTCEPTPSALAFLIGLSIWHRIPKVIQGVLVRADGLCCIHSCCFAIRRESYVAIGGFDESYDFLDADIDFSMRLNYAGWNAAVTEKVVCFHPGGGSPQSSSTRVIRMHRNRLMLLRNHGLLPAKSLTRFFLLSRHLVETVLLVFAVLLRRPDSKAKFRCRLRLLVSVFTDYKIS